MAKSRKAYVCSECGHDEPRWLGKCPSCGEWNSFREISLAASSGKSAVPVALGKPEEPIALEKIETENGPRKKTGMNEFDRILGGGCLAGSAILVGGEPGIGKSTLLLQAARSASDSACLYVSGEESPEQIKSRADRLKINKTSILVYCSTEIKALVEEIEKQKPEIVIIDSIQTLFSRDLTASPGSPAQLKQCCWDLITFCKKNGIILFLIGHITKEGILAGPKTIEHMVDTVLYFEHAESDLRLLKAVKNRFGDTDEIGIFRMGGDGLIQIENAEGLFLESYREEVPAGIAVTPIYEGSRILLVEIQALTVPAKGAVSRIFSDKVEHSRVSRIAAILEKYTGIKFSDQDIYINIAGGIKVQEVSADLPVALALYSARTGLPLSKDLIAAGELTLTGRIRNLSRAGKRIKAAADMGFSRFLLSAPEKTGSNNRNLLKVTSLVEAITQLFSKSEI